MSRTHALLILLMQHYRRFDYRLSFLEVQKLAYLLQEQGKDLQLDFGTLYYGPYANNLRLLLQNMENHFISSFGDNNNWSKRKSQMFTPDHIKVALAHLG